MSLPLPKKSSPAISDHYFKSFFHPSSLQCQCTQFELRELERLMKALALKVCSNTMTPPPPEHLHLQWVSVALAWILDLVECRYRNLRFSLSPASSVIGQHLSLRLLSHVVFYTAIISFDSPTELWGFTRIRALLFSLWLPGSWHTLGVPWKRTDV